MIISRYSLKNNVRRCWYRVCICTFLNSSDRLKKKGRKRGRGAGIATAGQDRPATSVGTGLKISALSHVVSTPFDPNSDDCHALVPHICFRIRGFLRFPWFVELLHNFRSGTWRLAWKDPLYDRDFKTFSTWWPALASLAMANTIPLHKFQESAYHVLSRWNVVRSELALQIFEPIWMTYIYIYLGRIYIWGLSAVVRIKRRGQFLVEWNERAKTDGVGFD